MGYAVNAGGDAAFGVGDEAAAAAAADAKLLSAVDADSWVNLQVVVKMGKYVGTIGTVLRSGNGWVHLQTETEGEIAKRAYELELLTGDDEQTKRMMID